MFCFRYDARTLLKAGVGEALKIDKELLEVTHLGPVGSRVLQTEHLWCRGSVHRKPQPHNTTHKPHNKPDNPKTSKPPNPQNPKTPKHHCVARYPQGNQQSMSEKIRETKERQQAEATSKDMDESKLSDAHGNFDIILGTISRAFSQLYRPTRAVL